VPGSAWKGLRIPCRSGNTALTDYTMILAEFITQLPIAEELWGSCFLHVIRSNEVSGTAVRLCSCDILCVQAAAYFGGIHTRAVIQACSVLGTCEYCSC
jgi:hypothetical protein